MSNKKANSSMPGMRVFSYSVAGVLGLLMVSSTLSPIIADSSTRALIDAPVLLLTSPIKGVVENIRMKPGDLISSGDVLATITNDSIDKSKLIELDLNISDIRRTVVSHEETIRAGEVVQQRLVQSIEEQSLSLLEQYSGQIEMAESEMARHEANVGIAKHLLAREQTLRSKGVVGNDLADFEHAVSDASSVLAQARSELEAATNRLSSAGRNVYLGSDAAPINNLLEELRSSRRATSDLSIEKAGLELRAVDLSLIRDREAERIARLSSQSIVAPVSGAVLEVGGSDGSTVSDGDAIANTIDCDSAFVVAIFSERKAPSLVPGEPVTVRGDGWADPVAGKIRKLVPRTTSIDDAGFAVPFPPTERRELYAFIDMEETARTPGEGTCEVGKWVSVSLDDGTIPSTDDLMRAASKIASTASSAVVRGAKDTAVQIAELAGRARDSFDGFINEAEASPVTSNEGRTSRIARRTDDGNADQRFVR